MRTTEPFQSEPPTRTEHTGLSRRLPPLLAEQALDAVSCGVLIARQEEGELRILHANEALACMAGKAHETLSEAGLSVLFGEENRSALEQIREAVRSRRLYRDLIRLRDTGGHDRLHEVELFPLEETLDPAHAVLIFTEVGMGASAELLARGDFGRDGLTGLLSRQALEDEIRRLTTVNNNPASRPVLLMVDVDHLSSINNVLGHQAGDQVLQEVARRMERLLGRDSVLARIGGDEFAVFLPDIREANEVFSRVTELMRLFSRPFAPRPGYDTYLSCTVGVSSLGVEDENTGEAEGTAGIEPGVLLQQAAVARSHAKEEGRGNTYFIYEPTLERRKLERETLRLDLCNAIRNRELEVHYQLQVNARTRTICGMEALLRWNHPEHGLISPDIFIPLAEETGMILELGLEAMRQACHFNQSLIQRRLLDVPVAVNISPAQLVREEFLDDVLSVLAETGLPAERLELEVTESMVMDDRTRTRDLLGQLRRYGVGVSIDDFGTGYSNLGYVKMETVCTLKIDRSFIKEVNRNSSDAGIVRAIISMAHNLGISVVAEGVETEAQATFLQRNRCDVLQGFHFYRPVSGEALEQVLGSGATARSPVPDEQESPRTLLLVDDEPNILRALTRILRGSEYRVLQAASGDEALDLMAREKVNVVLSDQRMPGMTGIELLSRVKQLYPEIVRMILSGYTELATVTEAINQGEIYRFLTKPWDERALREHIDEAFRHYENHAAELREDEAP